MSIHINNIKGDKMSRKDELIKQCLEIKEKMDELKQLDKVARMEMQIILKSESLTEYYDPSENKVSMSTFSRTSLSRPEVEKRMDPELFAECLKTTEVTSMKIVSKESNEKIKSMMQSKKMVS